MAASEIRLFAYLWAMAWLIGILIGLLVIDAILLTLLVLIQQGKGGGLATDIQGVAQASQLLGVRQAADFAEKATWTLFGALIVLTFLIHAVYSISRGRDADRRPRVADVVNTQPFTSPTTSPAQPAPATPAPAPQQP